MSIDIRAIKVILDTNIPGQTFMPLKKSMLYNPELNTNNFDEYPYFTMDVPYPESYLSSLPYQKQMDFFFIKSQMMKILKIYNKDTINMNVKDDAFFIKSVKESQAEIQETQKEKEEKQKGTIIKDEEIKEIKKIDAEILNLEKTFIYDFGGTISEKENIIINDEYINEKKKSLLEEKNVFEKEISELYGKMNKELDNIFAIKNDDNITFPKLSTGRANMSTLKNEWWKCAGESIYKEKNKIDIWNKWKNYMKSLYLLKESINKNIINKIYQNTELDELKDKLDALENIQLDPNDYEKNDKKEKTIYLKDNKRDKTTLFLNSENVPVVLNKKKSEKAYQENICKLQIDIEAIVNDELKKLCSQLIKDIKKININEIIKKEYDIFKTNIENLKKKQNEKKEKVFGKNTNPDEPEETNKLNTIKKKALDIKAEANIKQQSQYENSEKNIMIMLRLMFPTKYPFVNNIFESFSSVIMKNPVYAFKLMDFLPTFFKSKIFEGSISYSYLKINSKIYTIAQTIWLNDIYNHKEYSELVEKFDKLKKWKAKEIVNITIEIEKKREKFTNMYISGNYSITQLDIDNLESTNKRTELAEVGDRSYELVTQYTTYNQTLDNLIQAIKDLNGSISNREEYSDISDHAKNIATYYNILITNNQYRVWFNPKNKTKFDKFIANLNKDIEEIQILEYILEVYFERPGINLDYEKDEPKYRDKLKEKYRTYTDFAENIKKFRAPIRESSNYHLQQTINEFLDNTEKPKGIFNYIMNPYNMDTNPFTKYLKKNLELSQTEKEGMKKLRDDYAKRFNTGVTILPQSTGTEPYYEVYVQVNVIGGELNDENKSSIDCIYQGESLGDKLEYLLNETMYNRWDLNSARIFFNMVDGTIKKLDDGKVKKPDNKVNIKDQKEEKKNEPIKQQGGGLYSITRKVRANFMKTRKLYS